MKTPLVCALMALSLTFLCPQVSRAENEQDRRLAFQAAREAMQAKRWEEAHRIFVGLWSNQHTYDVALHMGQVEYHLKRFREAANHLAYGLMLLPPREKPEIAERSKALLGLCKAEVGTLELRVKNKQAEVLVDGLVVAEAPLVTDVYVDPGRHQFEVRLSGHTSERWAATFAKGEIQQRIVLLKPNAPDTTSASPTPTAAVGSTSQVNLPPMDERTSSGSWAPVIVGGAVTLVGLGAGLGFAIVRGGITDDARKLRSEIGEGNCRTANDKTTLSLCDQLQNKNSNYDSYGSLEAASFALGGIALVATTTYFLLSRPDRARVQSGTSRSTIQMDGGIGRDSVGLRLTAHF
ncbi:MAG: hypothetical protein QM784_14215 [Polyangiaceae bacterium]